MAISIDPACYTSSTSATYSKAIGDLFAKGLIHKAKVCVEVDSVGSPGTPVVPRNSALDIETGGNSQRTIYIRGTRERYLDETYLNFASTGLQGGLMFQLAKHVSQGILRVRDVATVSTYYTPAQIMKYATEGTWS